MPYVISVFNPTHLQSEFISSLTTERVGSFDILITKYNIQDAVIQMMTVSRFSALKTSGAGLHFSNPSHRIGPVSCGLLLIRMACISWNIGPEMRCAHMSMTAF